MRQFLSPYLYCANNPVNLIDPSGTYAVKDSVADGEGGWIYFMTWTELQGITVRPNSYPGWSPDYSTFFNDFNHGYWGQGVDVEVDMGGGGGAFMGRTMGMVSMAYSLALEQRDYSRYIPTKGPNKGVSVSVYKQNKMGDFVLKNGQKVARSANAQTVINTGKVVETTGKVLNIINAGIILKDINDNGFTYSNVTDAAFYGLGYIPGYGWMISGVYTLHTLLTPMYMENVFQPYIQTTGGTIYPGFMAVP